MASRFAIHLISFSYVGGRSKTPDCTARLPNLTDSTDTFEHMSNDLTEFLLNRDQVHDLEHQFDPRKHSHAALAAADIIRVAGILTTSELSQCLDVLGIDISRNQIDRY